MVFLKLNFSKQLIYPLLFTIFSPFKHACGSIFTSIIYGANFCVIFHSFALLFALIPFCLIKRKRKGTQSISLNNNTQHQLHKKSFQQIAARKDNKLKHYLIVVFIGLLTAIIQFLEIELFDILVFQLSSLSMFSIIFTFLFCSIIFGDKIYKHKIAGLILIVISIICVELFYFLGLFLNPKKSEKSTLKIISFIILILSQSLREVVEKCLMNSYRMDIFEIMFTEGIIEGSIGIIVLIIQIIIGKPISFIQNPSFDYYENGIILLAILCTIGLIITSFFVSLLRMKSNELYQPVSKYVFDSLLIVFTILVLILSPVILRSFDDHEIMIELFFKTALIDLEKVAKVDKLLLSLLGLLVAIILFFGTALFNEIIILYFCNLQKNTQIEICKRAVIEANDTKMEIIKYAGNDNDNDNYTDYGINEHTVSELRQIKE